MENPDTGQKIFGDTFDCETLISADTDTTALFEYDGPTVRYSDPVSSGGGGTVVINGQTYNIEGATSITVSSASGGTVTYSIVSDKLLIIS